MANDFSGDSSCKALWRFESGALTTDSKSTNTLTNNGGIEETTNHMEGSCAVAIASGSSQYLNIPNANLVSGFPLKSDDTTKVATFAFWFRAATVPGSGVYAGMLSKWDWANSKPCISIQLTNSKLRLCWGYGTGQTQEYLDTATISANIKYHVVVTLDGVNKIAYVWVYNLSTGTLSSYSKNFTNALRVVDIDFRIGSETACNYYNGVIDEVVVLNRMVNEIEAIKLRSGAYSAESQLDALAVYAVVDYMEESETKISQVVATVEWVPTDPNTHLYSGSIGIGITPQGTADPVWEKAGSVPIEVTPQGLYFYEAPGEFQYYGSIPVAITPDSDYVRGFAFRSSGIGVAITPQADYLFPDHFYESAGIEVTILPASTYRTPIPGWDVPSGYGLVDFTDLGDPPPFWCIDTDGITLALDNTAEKFDLYAEYLIETDGGLVVGGGCGFEVVDPGIAEITTAGGVRVGGDFDVDFPEPWITSLALEGGVAVSGALKITEVDPATFLITEITTSKGVVVGGYLGFSFVDQKELITTISVSGGVVVGERRYPPIEFISPVPEEVYYELTTGGTVYVGGELGIDIPEPGVYEWTIRRGGVKVGGACTFGFWIPPITQFDILGGVLVEGSIIEDLELFETWALTGFAYSPSMYSRFNFNSYADRNGQILAAKEDGIYVLEGDDDDGQQIHDGMRLGPANFGTDNLKGARAIYPGDAGIPEAHVIAETKGREGYFKLQRDRFNVTTDILDRIMTIEIADFEKLSHFEIIPVVRVKR